MKPHIWAEWRLSDEYDRFGHSDPLSPTTLSGVKENIAAVSYTLQFYHQKF
jgi:hypothetical protein